MPESFFDGESLEWWGEVPSAAPPTPAAAARARPRTFAADVARVRTGLERRSPLPGAVASVVALFLVAALAVVIRLSLLDDRPEEVSAAAAQTAAPAGAGGAAAAPAPVTTAPLEEGDRGPRVRDLQLALAALGLFSGVDGSYGPTTTAAVAAFQASSGLAADGIAGPSTAKALRQAAWERAQPEAAAIRAGIAAAAREGAMDATTAEAAVAAVGLAARSLRSQEPGRAALIGVVLRDVAAAANGYSTARAPLFTELTAGVQRLRVAPPEIGEDTVSDGSGVVYRLIPEHGYRFHPLASFSRLNRLAGAGRAEEAGRLARALVARGVRSGNTLLWQYRFPFGGPEVWTSGFAQAAGAQALARAGDLLGDASLLVAAGASFRAIPRSLTLPVGGGAWIQEYSFSSLAVLNAQLQSIVSLTEYASLSGDAEAEAFVAGLSETTRSVLGEFDTGCWSRYSLHGTAATPAYHAYHVKLLDRLGRRTGDAAWGETAARWRGYEAAGGC